MDAAQARRPHTVCGCFSQIEDCAFFNDSVRIGSFYRSQKSRKVVIPEGEIVIKLHPFFISTVTVNNNPGPSAIYLGIPRPDFNDISQRNLAGDVVFNFI
ncbi:hypothetical protein WP8W19C02_20830 [Enterobacter cloacae]|nr:hypothetical protein WP8W19C02_20830 [Enterobacter cloacae]